MSGEKTLKELIKELIDEMWSLNFNIRTLNDKIEQLIKLLEGNKK